MSGSRMTRRGFGASLAVPLAARAQGDGWESLFDGRSLKGWEASEHKGSWTAREGALVGDGPRSHLFYNLNPA